MANKQYFASFKGKNAKVYEFNGQVYRTFQMKFDIVNAIIDNASQTIAITTKDGRTTLYRLDGMKLRVY